jgi:hypothetical protein
LSFARLAQPALLLKKDPHETVISRAFQSDNSSLTQISAGESGSIWEDTMRYQSFAAPVLALGLVLSAAAAYAQDEEPTSVGCLHMAKQVRDSLRSNAASTNADKANQERRDGDQACQGGYYKLGLAHYKKALELLSAA